MPHVNFEDFLQEQHILRNPTLLDDDIPDAFDDWLGNLDTEEWIALGDAYKAAPDTTTK